MSLSHQFSENIQQLSLCGPEELLAPQILLGSVGEQHLLKFNDLSYMYILTHLSLTVLACVYMHAYQQAQRESTRESKLCNCF